MAHTVDVQYSEVNLYELFCTAAKAHNKNSEIQNLGYDLKVTLPTPDKKKPKEILWSLQLELIFFPILLDFKNLNSEFLNYIKN